MTSFSGTFHTPNARKYLVQLCKHFAHKIDVSYTEEEGSCDFEIGTAKMTADDELLTIHVTANDTDMVPQLKFVIDRHLEKFAFREDFTAMDWTV
ncbi:MAG: DUF2218 domain-containing protein [Shimia sp.]|nr:DUF2218 domain-containing protein [Shimia sp.]